MTLLTMIYRVQVYFAEQIASFVHIVAKLLRQKHSSFTRGFIMTRYSHTDLAT